MEEIMEVRGHHIDGLLFSFEGVVNIPYRDSVDLEAFLAQF